MTIGRSPLETTRFAAWSAIVGSLMIFATLGLLTVVTGPDTERVFSGATMLALPSQTRDLFRWAMLTDVFGFYMPFIAIGGCLWHAFREEAGALGHMAALALAFYITVGIGGAVIQLAEIVPLSQLYAVGDVNEKAGASLAWTAFVTLAQRGLWWSEAPAFFLWTLIVGRLLREAGWGGARLLRATGLLAGGYFLTGFFPGLETLTNGIEMLVVSMLPLWMILFGFQLLLRSRKPTAPNVGFTR